MARSGRGIRWRRGRAHEGAVRSVVAKVEIGCGRDVAPGEEGVGVVTRGLMGRKHMGRGGAHGRGRGSGGEGRREGGHMGGHRCLLEKNKLPFKPLALQRRHTLLCEGRDLVLNVMKGRGLRRDSGGWYKPGDLRPQHTFIRHCTGFLCLIDHISQGQPIGRQDT